MSKHPEVLERMLDRAVELLNRYTLESDAEEAEQAVLPITEPVRIGPATRRVDLIWRIIRTAGISDRIWYNEETRTYEILPMAMTCGDEWLDGIFDNRQRWEWRKEMLRRTSKGGMLDG